MGLFGGDNGIFGGGGSIFEQAAETYGSLYTGGGNLLQQARRTFFSDPWGNDARNEQQRVVEVQQAVTRRKELMDQIKPVVDYGDEFVKSLYEQLNNLGDKSYTLATLDDINKRFMQHQAEKDKKSAALQGEQTRSLMTKSRSQDTQSFRSASTLMGGLR